MVIIYPIIAALFGFILVLVFKSNRYLFESSEGHKINFQKLLLIGLGVLTAYFI